MKKKINYLITAMLDLQLFAVNKTTDVRDPVTGEGNDLSPEMKEFYDRVLIEEAGPNLVHAQFGQKKPIPKNNGKIITFRKFEPLMKALGQLDEGTTPEGGKLDVTEIMSEIGQYGYFVVLSDLLELTAIDPVVVEATKLIGQQAGRTMDTIVRNVLNSGTNVRYCPKLRGSTETPVSRRAALDATAKLTPDMVQQVVADLRAMDAPTINGDYVAIIHPYAAYDLMRNPEWIDAQKYVNPEKIYNGEIGKIGGVRFVQSSEAKIIRGEDLASDSRTLSVNGAVTAGTTIINFDGGTVAANALKGKTIVVDSYEYVVDSNSASTITVKSDVPLLAIADNTVIYPAGASDGGAVFSTLFLGANAYGDTEIADGGLRTIVKQLGYGDDPLDQRASVGWKGTKTAEILVEQYIVRVESCSPRFSATAVGN